MKYSNVRWVIKKITADTDDDADADADADAYTDNIDLIVCVVFLLLFKRTLYEYLYAILQYYKSETLILCYNIKCNR